MPTLPKVFYADRRSTGKSRDAAIHKHGSRWLRRVAHDLHLRAREHEIVAEPAVAGRGCRVTLLAPGVLLEVADLPQRHRVAVTFRTRRSSADLSGGRDNAVALEQLASAEGYGALLDGLTLSGSTKHGRS